MKIVKGIFPAFVLLLFSFSAFCQSTFNVKGLCIGDPARQDVDDFVKLIDKKLASAGVNTLVLRIDYRYEYISHPELRAQDALSEKEVKKL